MTSIKVKKIDSRIGENYTKIKLSGSAEIVCGDNTIKCRNKFTRYLMSSIIVLIANTEKNSCVRDLEGDIYSRGFSYYLTAKVGTDTSTSTNPDMSDLVSKVDVAPDSITRRLIKEPDYTLYIAEFVFTWNAETLPDIYIGATGENEIDGKVGEFGVYLALDIDDWQSGLTNPQRGSCIGRGTIPVNNVARRLASRIASADDAFDAFEFYGSIDPLTFKWRFQVAIV